MVRFRLALTAGLAALLIAPAGEATPPRQGLVVPGASLGGLALGATRTEVRAAWGTSFGVCRDCRAQTWYFNLRPFEPQGAGVAFRRGRAVALFTVWSPPGWRTTRGLRIGDPEFRIAALYGSLLRVDCGRYSARTLRGPGVTTSFYVVDEQVWGFGLSVGGLASVCR
jgi:hypothetical protein